MARSKKKPSGLDAGFESYRRERNKRRISSGGGPTRPMGDKGKRQVLQELEEAEARDARNQQLTREVREFFEDATRTAATIVQRVAEEQEGHTEERLASEMSEFLRDAVHRAQGYIQILALTSDGREAQKEVVANMQNLVGPLLDGFRHEGTAALPDKHIGLDPFAGGDEDGEGDVEDVPGDGDDVVEVDLDAQEEPSDEFVADAPPTPQAVPQPEAAEPVASHDQDFDEDDVSPASMLGEWFGELDVDTVKSTLKLLVQCGAMPKEFARDLYRVEMTGRATAGR